MQAASGERQEAGGWGNTARQFSSVDARVDWVTLVTWVQQKEASKAHVPVRELFVRTSEWSFWNA